MVPFDRWSDAVVYVEHGAASSLLHLIGLSVGEVNNRVLRVLYKFLVILM
jgi:hypothetical protein